MSKLSVMKISKRAAVIQPSPTLAITAKANAMKAVAFSLTTQAQLDALRVLENTPTTKRALARVDKELAKDLPGTPATDKDNFILDPVFWAQHGAQLQKRMQEWLVS